MPGINRSRFAGPARERLFSWWAVVSMGGVSRFVREGGVGRLFSLVSVNGHWDLVLSSLGKRWTIDFGDEERGRGRGSSFLRGE